MFYTYLFLLLVFSIFLRPISTLLHELGHGIPALLLTNDKVTLYLGSYGDPTNSRRIELGRLELFIRRNPFRWKLGLCKIHDETTSIKSHIFITLMGPIMSLALALAITYLVFLSTLHEDIKAFMFFFGLSTYYDFFVNSIPRKEPIQLYDGTTTFNDGQTIINLIRFYNLPVEYTGGIELLENNEFEKAGKIFDKILHSGYKQDNIYRIAISAFLNAHDYQKANEINREFEQKQHRKNFDSNDYCNAGLAKSYLKEFSESLKDYDKSLELNPNNTYTLNNRGYTYSFIEEYQKAIVDFDKAIALEPESAYPYNNRGLAKIKLGNTEEGLRDIEKSMELDENNAYAHMNLGIYHYDLGEYKRALEKFNLALELDHTTYEIHDRIEETKRELGIL